MKKLVEMRKSSYKFSSETRTGVKIAIRNENWEIKNCHSTQNP